MGDTKSSTLITIRDGGSSKDRELLVPVADSVNIDVSSSSSSSSSDDHSGREACSAIVRSWASRKFMTGCVILFPIAFTCYITWGFIHIVDGLFSPVYEHLGIDFFGLGFITTITVVFLVGVFMSSWLGASVLGLGEWFIKRMPLVRHIYSASKQISAAISPDQNTKAFKEVAIIRHPRVGEYAFGFITSTVVLQSHLGDEELCCVFVPTNHLYLGDIILINNKDVFRPNLTVSEGIDRYVRGNVNAPDVIYSGHEVTVTKIIQYPRETDGGVAKNQDIWVQVIAKKHDRPLGSPK